MATLKREADCEIARIVRCTKNRWEPKRLQLVPRGWVRRGVRAEAAQPLALAFQPFELSLVSGRIIRGARGAEAPLEGCFAEFERKLFQAGYATQWKALLVVLY